MGQEEVHHGRLPEVQHPLQRDLLHLGTVLDEQRRQVRPFEVNRVGERVVVPLSVRCARLEQHLDEAMKPGGHGDPKWVADAAPTGHALGQGNRLALPHPLLDLKQPATPAERLERFQILKGSRADHHHALRWSHMCSI